MGKLGIMCERDIRDIGIRYIINLDIEMIRYRVRIIMLYMFKEKKD